MRRALPFVALYLVLALAFFLLMRDHAFHPTDDGFVLAYSWRIANGEVPYRDFLYERTPLTPYLHLAWVALPDGWAIPAGRLAFYLEMAGAAAFPTIWAVGRGLRATIPALAIAGATFLLSLHNFPPMPWPTIDGIFFASAGAAAFLAWHDGRSLRWLAAAMALLGLSTLAKQSYAPVLLVAGLYALVVAIRRRDPRILLAAAVPPLLLAVVFAAALVATGSLTAFAQQISAPTQMRPSEDNPWSGDLVAIGIDPYIVELTPGLGVFLAILAYVFIVRDRSVRVARYALPLALALLLVGALALPTNVNGAGIAVFLGVAMLAIADALRSARGAKPAVPLLAYVLVLGTAWCAGLSFAYQTPLLAIGAVGPLIALAVVRQPSRFEDVLAVVTFAAVAVVLVFINVELPYRDAPRADETADLGEIYPRLGHLYTNPINAARHRELRDFTQRYALDPGREFVVLTAFPLTHFLTDTRSPLSLDWLEPQEYLGNDDRLRSELVASRPVVILQRQIGESVGKGPPALSCSDAAAGAPKFARDTLARDTLVTEGTYFCVYAP
jgi:hypothetical protein